MIVTLRHTIDTVLVEEPNEPLTLAEYDRLDDPSFADFYRMDPASQREHTARERRRRYERRVGGHQYGERASSKPIDPFEEYSYQEREGWQGALDPQERHILSRPVHHSDWDPYFYEIGASPRIEHVQRTIPEAVEYRITVTQQLSTGGDTFTQLMVALALSPFITAISTSLGNKVTDHITNGYRKAVERLLKDRTKATKATLPNRGHTSVVFEMRVEGTRIRIELPREADQDLLATCIFMLDQMEFEIFGDCRTILHWSEDTWHAAAAVPDREPVSLVWKREDREWQPLHSGVELPLPVRNDDEDHDTSHQT